MGAPAVGTGVRVGREVGVSKIADVLVDSIVGVWTISRGVPVLETGNVDDCELDT